MKIFIILSLILMVSCNIGHENNSIRHNNYPKTISIELDNPRTFVFSEVFDKPVFIALETNPRSLFSEINQLIIADSLIFVVPKNPEHSVIIFNLNGSHRNTIWNVGRGPDEYISLMAIYVSETEHLIYSFDPGNKRFICMDYDGRIVRSINSSGIYGWGMAINPTNGNLLVDLEIGGIDLPQEGNGLSPFILAEFNMDDKTVKPWFAVPRKGDFHCLYGFSSHHDTLIFKSVFRDTIYHVLSDSILPRYIFDFGQYSKPVELLNATEDSEFFNTLKSGRFVLYHRNFIENDGFVFTTHRTSKSEYLINLFNKNEESSNVFMSFKNGFIGQSTPVKIGYKVLPVGIYDNKIIFIHDPADIKRNISQLNKISSSSEFFNNINPTDNPIIGLYPIKIKD